MPMTMTMRVARWVEYLQGVPKTQMHPWYFPLELFLSCWSTPLTHPEGLALGLKCSPGCF